MSIVMRVGASEVGTWVTEVITLNSSLASGRWRLTAATFSCFGLSSTKYKSTPKMVSPHSIAHHFAGRDTKRLTPPTPRYIFRGSKSFGPDLKSGASPIPEVPHNSDAIQVVWNLSLSLRGEQQ